MSIQTIVLLIVIGLISGMLSGIVGVGGGIVVVPALIFLLGFNQLQAQGTSLFVLLLPIGLLAVSNYWSAGYVNWKYGLVIALAFFIGGYFGSKIALRVSPALIQIFFALFMLYISFKLLISGYNTWNNVN